MQSKDLGLTAIGVLMSLVLVVGLVVIFQKNFTGPALSEESMQYLLIDMEEEGGDHGDEAGGQESHGEEAADEESHGEEEGSEESHGEESAGEEDHGEEGGSD